MASCPPSRYLSSDFISIDVAAIRDAANPRSIYCLNDLASPDALVCENPDHVFGHDAHGAFPDGSRLCIPENSRDVHETAVFIVLTISDATQTFHGFPETCYAC
ncbi:hypothetical protein KCU73_g97, partial [Aureobasidium melanogenum]